MLRRKISDTLTEWKNRPHKCLLLKGQRQVGKTFSVREFARSDYENFVEYNLSTDISCRRIFEGDLDVDSLISAMSLFSPDVEIKPKSTLIFIDEIQEFPRAKEALKSFTLDGRYDVIASGSMLGIDLPKDPQDEGSWKSEGDREPMEPSGYVEDATMYALDFEEFCWAGGVKDREISKLRSCIKDRKPIGPAFMDAFDRLFRDYMLVGGTRYDNLSADGGNSSFEIPVAAMDAPVSVVDFNATWCGPCRMLAPVLEEISEKYAGRVSFFSVDVDESPGLAMQYRVNSVPCLVLLKNGEFTDQAVGFRPEPQLTAWIDGNL